MYEAEFAERQAQLCRDVAQQPMTRRKLLKSGATSLGALGVLGIAGCGSTGGGKVTSIHTAAQAGPTSAVKKGGTLVFAVDVVTGSVEPEIFAGFGPWMALDSIGRGLTHIDFYTLSPQPAVAQSWKISRDQLTYTFAIRKNLKFHDGSEVTAHDCQRTFERLMNPKDPSSVPGSYVISEIGGSNIKSTRVIDDKTFEIKLATPDAIFVKRLSHPGGRIFSAAAINKYGKHVGSHPICCGPYKLVKAKPNDSLTLAPFDDYYDGRPPLKSVVFQQLTDTGALTAAVLSNQVQATIFLPISSAAQVVHSPQVKIFEATPGTDIFINMNAASGPLRDLRVRQAINYAIDRNQVLRDVFFGRATLPAGLVPPTQVGYSAALKVYSTQNLVKAKQLLKEAGAVGATIRCLHQNDDIYPRLGQVIDANLRAVGLKPVTEYVDPGTFNTRWFEASQHELVTNQRASFIPDPDDKYSAQLMGDSTFAESASGTTKLPVQKELDRLIVAARQEPDSAKRAAKYKQLDVFQFEHVMVFAMLAYTSALVVGSNRVVNLDPNALGTDRCFLDRAGYAA